MANKANLLGAILQQKGLLTEDVIVEALRRQREEEGWDKLGFGSIIVLMGVVSRDKMNEVLTEQNEGKAKITDTEHAYRNLPVAIRNPIPWPPQK